MYRNHHNGHLSIEEFHLPFGGTLDPENRWVLFATLLPSDEIEEAYATQFSPTTGVPAKPARLAFGALFIKQRLGLSDEETVEQIRANPYLQFFLGFAGYSTKAPFDPSMMVHFRKVQPSRRVAIFRERSQSDHRNNCQTRQSHDERSCDNTLR